MEKTVVIRDIDTLEIVRDDLPRTDENGKPLFDFPKGAKGLFAVAEVQEPEVVIQVKDGRLNSFSWQGALKRLPSGAIKSIDLWEISLVNMPANQDAVLRVGKNISTQLSGTKQVIHVTVDDIVADFLHPTSPVGKNADALYALLYEPSPEEGVAKDDDANHPEKGGDIGMDKDELKKLLNEQGDTIGSVVATALKANLDPVQEKMDEIAKRVDALEEGTKETPKDADTTSKDADGKDAEKKEADSTTKDVEFDQTKFLEALSTSVAETVKQATDPIAESVEKVADRVASLEKKPAESKAAKDDDASDVADTFADSVQKNYQALDANGRKNANLGAVATLLIPEYVSQRPTN
jgi:uncharacterized coiled-coil protein SlyX